MEIVGSVGDYYEGSFKSAKSFKSVMVSLRRWVNEVGLGGRGVKSFRSFPNIRNHHNYSLFLHLRGFPNIGNFSKY